MTSSLMTKLPVVFNRDNWRNKLLFVEKYGNFVKIVKFHYCDVKSTDEILETLKMTLWKFLLISVTSWSVEMKDVNFI